jgi:hypothetical protein
MVWDSDETMSLLSGAACYKNVIERFRNLYPREIILNIKLYDR